MDRLDFSVLDNDWTADEELILLQNLDRYGLGNWEEIAKRVGHSESKCEEHYYQYYVDFPGSTTEPYPDVSRCTERKTLIPLSPSTMAEMLKKAEVRLMTLQHGPTKKKVLHADGSLTQNFDVEYDNDAEAELADLTIGLKDSEFEVMLKDALLEAYNCRLEERRKRKEFVLERDLLDVKKQRTSDSSRNKPEKKLHLQLRVFSRFMAPGKYDELLKDLVQEQKLRKQLRLLWARSHVE